MTTTFVSATGAQPWWDWGYYLIMLQIMVVMSGIACIVWIINWKKRKEGEQKERAASTNSRQRQNGMGFADQVSTLIFALIVIGVIVYLVMSAYVVGPVVAAEARREGHPRRRPGGHRRHHRLRGGRTPAPRRVLKRRSRSELKLKRGEKLMFAVMRCLVAIAAVGKGVHAGTRDRPGAGRATSTNGPRTA